MSSLNYCVKCQGEFIVRRPEARGLCPRCGFWSQVNIAGHDDCWLWTGKLNRGGYGAWSMELNGKREHRSHRLSWIMTNGPIDHDMCVLHCCDWKYAIGDITNRRCVNPSHLRIGTRIDNIVDMDKHGRRALGDKHGSMCHPERRPRGKRHGAIIHPESRPRGEQHGRAKLNTEQVRYIRSCGISGSELARQFCVSRDLISRIRLGKLWQHLLI